MPHRYTDRILDHLSHETYRPVISAMLMRDLRVGGDDREKFEASLERLVAEERIEIGVEDKKIRLPAMGDEIIGSLRVTQRGFGFILPETRYREGDLFVPEGNLRDAITGDKVRAKVLRQPWRAKTQPGRSGVIGRVEEVVERGRNQFVGKLVKDGKQWFVEADGRHLQEPVAIRDPHAKNAKAGDKVVIELLHYPEGDYVAEGVIVEVLGEAGKPDVETAAVIAAHGLRTDFPDAVVTEAREAQIPEDVDELVARGEREDLTDDYIFTIDPPDAKDFDDAISIERDGDQWTLGVHIADVATFVRTGGALDEEARARGNSVYLPRLVIPMLPEVLSNGICSLQEGVHRLTKSVFITFDKRGKVMSQRVSATIIKSRKRLTYLEAQSLIDGDVKEARKHSRTEPVYDDVLVEKLKMADTLAKTLKKRRWHDGMISLQLPEVELVFDDEGHVTDAVPEDDAFTHTIIEMFMVEANEALARTFDDLETPVLRRIHPDPKFGAIEELRLYAAVAGHRLPENPSRKDFQALLDATRNTESARAIHFAVLRTLSKATYSPALIGHFALASDHYTHFTSPIRRYPDLLLHRALEAFLEATENGTKVPGGRKRDALAARLADDSRVLSEDVLITLGRHCSDTEKAAEEAERELRTFLVLQFLAEHHLGEEFDGVVTGVMNAGAFVSIERYLAEGLIRINDLPSSGKRPDRWEIDQRNGRLVAQRSGASLGLGDKVRVQIVKVDLSSRHLDLQITEMSERSKEPAPAVSERRVGGQRHRDKKHSKGYGKGRRGRRGR